MNALLAVSVACCLLAVSAVQADTYPAEYDNLPIDALLSNEDKVNMFGGCLLDDAICTEKALKLKGLCVFKNIGTGRFSYLFPENGNFNHTESLLRP
jgi:hypothetical protein